MPNPKQEQFCITELSKWLMIHGAASNPRFEPGPEPPDFWLWMGTDKFAIEVTQVIHEKDRRITASQYSLVNEAEETARDFGLLSGCYLIDLCEPIASNRERTIAKSLILEYLAATKSLTSADFHPIRGGARLVCRIKKEHDQHNAIYPFGGGADTGGYVDDVIDELSNILRDRICSKKKKLSKLEHPAILILHDQYSFAEPELFTKCVRSVSEHTYFDSIYVVVSEGSGFMITKGEHS